MITDEIFFQSNYQYIKEKEHFFVFANCRCYLTFAFSVIQTVESSVKYGNYS